MDDRIFVKGDKAHSGPGKDRVEYVRADALRECFTTKLWQAVVQIAQATPGVSAPAVKQARDLVEEFRGR